MTCDQYIGLLLRGNQTELNEGEALDHSRSCTRCFELRGELDRAQTRLANVLSAARSSIHPAVLADRAIVGARLRTIERGLLIIPAVLIVLILGLSLLGLPDSTVALLTGRRPLPAVMAETIALRCLSSEQAQTLALPYLNSEHDAIVGGGSISTLTVRGTPEAIKLTKEVIERFESHPKAACRGK